MSSDPFPLINEPDASHTTSTSSPIDLEEDGNASAPVSGRNAVTVARTGRRKGRGSRNAKVKGSSASKNSPRGVVDGSKLASGNAQPGNAVARIRKPRNAGSGDRASRRVRRASLTSAVEIYRIDPMVALRVSVAFFFCVYLVMVVACATLVIGGQVTGLTSGFTDFLADIGWDDVRVDLVQLAIGVTLAGVIFVIASSLLTAFLVVFYNLISEVVGGFRVVLSDQTVPADENVVDADVG